MPQTISSNTPGDGVSVIWESSDGEGFFHVTLPARIDTWLPVDGATYTADDTVSIRWDHGDDDISIETSGTCAGERQPWNRFDIPLSEDDEGLAVVDVAELIKRTESAPPCDIELHITRQRDGVFDRVPGADHFAGSISASREDVISIRIEP